MMQAGKDYGVRVVRAYSQFSVGRILFPDGGLRADLIRRGLVVPVKAPEEARKKPREEK